MSDTLRQLKAAHFHPLLAEISDPPKQLYVRGELPRYDDVWLAVVGSRAASSYGRQACEHLIGGLRGYPIVIVSGLAYGIDACAHKAALSAGLPTVAVPGSGLDWDVIYPRAHVGLAREILKAGGALLSEFEPKQKAADHTFPQRNRIMAGLCLATLVIEAKERSGSLITARLTTEYNRELLVVPGSIFSAESRGTHQFLKLGATPVTEPEDILKALGIEMTDIVSPSLREDLSSDERKVLEILSSPCSRDELLSQLEMSISEANILLSTMEIKGLIQETLGLVRAI
ncbi:MAG: DNA processing protein [Parcubacteria group bacterium Gr01-1014_8]|nr:MAG: DNA processing protein [Parcubacteria group bacterium Gr01-1014_8]